MKPADLYLTSRHIFGFLIPGVVWSLALRSFLHTLHLSLASFLPGSLPLSNWGIAVGMFLFCSYLAGMLLQWPSFQLATLVEGTGLLKYLVRERDSVRATLEVSAHNLLVQKYPLVAAQLPSPADAQFRMAMFRVCKKIILARSAELSRSLFEAEDDINLCGMLALPLIALVIGIFVDSFSKAGERTLSAGVKIVISLGILLVSEAYLLTQFQIRRSEEKNDCYSTFILLESNILKQPAAPEKTDLETAAASS